MATSCFGVDRWMRSGIMGPAVISSVVELPDIDLCLGNPIQHPPAQFCSKSGTVDAATILFVRMGILS